MALVEVDVTIAARGDQATQPWLWQLSQNFKLKFNVFKASVEPDYGWIHLKLTGPVEEVQRAVAWLMTTGMHVESEQRAVGARPVGAPPIA